LYFDCLAAKAVEKGNLLWTVPSLCSQVALELCKAHFRAIAHVEALNRAKRPKWHFRFSDEGITNEIEDGRRFS
jgi:hypothetical protein